AAPAAAAAPFDPFGFAAPAATATAAQPNHASPFVTIAALVQPVQQLQQQSFAVFPDLQQGSLSQPRPSLQQMPAVFDDDFGDFVAAAAAATNQTTVQHLQQAPPKTSVSLFDDDFENVPPALPAKDYGNLFDTPPPPPARDYAKDDVFGAATAAPAARPSAPAAVDALAGLFATSTTLAPASSAALDARPLAPAASASQRMTTADILSLYGGVGARNGGGPPALANNFASNFGGPGASWA
ncbi:hypothetical protein PFISCL1PPCAC_12057, partial [Pristionchus fissidentatus]